MNRLAGETSPYLLQHADNPVDWYPWGPDALARARAEDRPIFLSIGYAACHWCHVMERESFEDDATAARMNAAFVCVKVDREERPDLDVIYMTAVQAMTGQGGWPMSVFLTPEGRPFYGGTYFPSSRGRGMPAFGDVLAAVGGAWRDRRGEIEAMARRLSEAIARSNLADPGGRESIDAHDVAEEVARSREGVQAAGSPGSGPPPAPGAASPPGAISMPDPVPAPGASASDRLGAAGATVIGPSGLGAAVAGVARDSPSLIRVPLRPPAVDPDVLDRAASALAASFDRGTGGWGTAPKFPQPATIEFLLARAATRHDDEALAIAERALDAMAAGGIHDQVGGGFHRYSTDARWLVPHFEKMLYDNAQLARAYVHAFQLTGDPRHGRIAGRTLDYLRREMATSDGLFAASQDADTGGIEGATYTWTLSELSQLGTDAGLVASAFGVTAAGNWEGRNVPYRALDDAALATLHGPGPEQVAERLEAARGRLLRLRSDRPQPARDGKALASWNGLAIAAFADAARVLGRPEDLATATRAADAALRLLRGADGRLRRSWKDGRAVLQGYLEDHAFLADGLLTLYAATFDERWFAAARGLAEVILAHFADPAGGFWDTADDHEALIARPRQVEDGAVPSGGAVAAAVLLRLAALTGEERYRAAAETALPPVAPLAARYPTGFAAWLQAIDLASAPIDEVAIIGGGDDPGAHTLVRVATRGLHPHRVVAMTSDPGQSRVELLQSRFALRGRATAFVCRDFSCRQPVTEPEALAAQLAD